MASCYKNRYTHMHTHTNTHTHTHTHTNTQTHTHTHTHTPSTQPLRCLTLCSLCTTYEQTWEMCKSSVDGRAKGEGSDSISRFSELTFTLVLAYNAIGPVASTVDPVTMLRLVHTQAHTFFHVTHYYYQKTSTEDWTCACIQK